MVLLGCVVELLDPDVDVVPVLVGEELLTGYVVATVVLLLVGVVELLEGDVEYMLD
jgi:hypothetical protein